MSAGRNWERTLFYCHTCDAIGDDRECSCEDKAGWGSIAMATVSNVDKLLDQRDERDAEIERLRALLSDQINAAPGIGDNISVQGIVSSRNHEPLVHMRAGEAAWQFSLAQAREHAMDTLAATIEAERDAATIAFLKAAGSDDHEAGGFLMALRDHRVAWVRDNAVLGGDPR